MIPHSLARSLEPVLLKQTNNQLKDINWFKTDWQRGGAATGYAVWVDEEGAEHPAVLKIPIVRKELRWTKRMQGMDGVTPRLFAYGEQLNGYDLAWMIIERFPVGPLGKHWADSNIERIADAAARFTAAASVFDLDQEGRSEDWKDLIQKAKKSIRENHIENEKDWKKTQAILYKKLDSVLELWRSRRIDQWLHGDLHLANAMCRTEQDLSPGALIDLAEVHAGHWIEDAGYLERHLWGHQTRLKATKPVNAMAAARRKHGLRVDDDYINLVDIRRMLLAATAPAYMQSEGDPRYLAACLEQLQNAMARLKIV